jgi:hypothetical protein
MMVEIPRSILSDHFQDRLSGKRLLSAVFVTYQYDPGFFEQEILPVFVDVPLSHQFQIRLVQLEDTLRDMKGDIAVYYDHEGLVVSDSGSAHLDTARIPVRHGTGVFHPKNIFLLVEKDEADESGFQHQSLLVASLSANLTRSGWWSNVEVCHVEEITQDVGTRLKDDLILFINRIKTRSRSEKQHKAINTIQSFLKSSIQLKQKSINGKIHPHFYAGDINFNDFLHQVAGSSIKHSYLEIISPFFDKNGTGKPLKDLLKRFKPRETLIYLPRSESDLKQVNKELFEFVQSEPNVNWGKLPGNILKKGKGESTVQRFVHAKVYRFFTLNPKREICFIGSVNLTNAAHQKGGNIESGFLTDLRRSSGTGFWLELDNAAAQDDYDEVEDEKAPNAQGTALNIRYNWITSSASAYWDKKSKSDVITLKGHDGLEQQLDRLDPAEWVDLPNQITKWLKNLLTESSILKVVESDKTSLLLIQEEGVSHKPSMLLNLSIVDILRYWALLTSEQRNAFIEAHSSELTLDGLGSHLVAKIKTTKSSESFFDRFAGIFHSFSCLEGAIATALDTDRIKVAEYRLFGKKYDSLSSLLDKVEGESHQGDPIDAYLIFLCAHQLINDISAKYSTFWDKHETEVSELQSQMKKLSSIRKRLIDSDPATMKEYLNWFDKWFLTKAPSLLDLEQ